MEKVTTNHLHYLMPHVPQKFMKLKPSQKPGRYNLPVVSLLFY